MNVGTFLDINYRYPNRITDRNGNVITITYGLPAICNDLPFLSFWWNLVCQYALINRVESSDGRYLQFYYYPQGHLGVIDANGRFLTYTYLNDNLFAGNPALSGSPHRVDWLSQVEGPEGLVWRYEKYPGQVAQPPNYAADQAKVWRMKTVTFPHGGTVTYDYAWSNPVELWNGASWQPTHYPVLISKQKSDGSNWSYGYQFSNSPGVLDQTTVSGPDGNVIYRHYGLKSVTTSDYWRQGTLAQLIRGTEETIDHEWAPQHISNDAFYVASAATSINATYRSLLAATTTTRGNATFRTAYSSHDGFGFPGTITETFSENGAPVASRTTTRTYYNDTARWIIGKVQNETITGAGSVTRAFDPNGNLLSLTKLGVATTYTYEPNGNLVTETDAIGKITRYTNYKHGIPQIITHADGFNTIRVVDNFGNITRSTNRRGFATNYNFDALNRLRSVDHPIGADETLAWAGVTQLTKTRGGYTEIINYDGFGRPRVFNRGSIVSTVEYDAYGRVRFESLPGAATGTSYEYDLLGRLKKITNSDDSFKTLTYFGNQVTLLDERNQPFVGRFRSWGDPNHRELMSLTTPVAAANLTFVRNGRGQITSVTQNGKTRTFTYNPTTFFLENETHAEQGAIVYGRDGIGNMRTRTVGGSPATAFGYDDLHRLRTVTLPAGEPAITFTRDENGNIKTANRGNVQRSFFYDENDNLRIEHLKVDNHDFVTTYGIDALDHVREITYPSGRRVTYNPDALGRPTKAAPFVNSVQFHPSGQVSQMVYANGVTQTVGFQGRYWPNTLSVQKGPAVYLNSALAYDPGGNTTAITDSVFGEFNRTLGYDGLNRLVTALGPWGGSTNNIAYSGDGNILSQGLGATSLAYNYDGTTNRLNSVTGSKSYSFTYDVYGNVTNNGQRTFTYDNASDLRCINCGQSNQSQFDYDANHMRTVGTKGGTKTYWVYAKDGNLLAEYQPQTASVKEYYYLAGKPVAQLRSDQFGLNSLADTDGDGIPDAWEAKHGLNPMNAADAQQDKDGDGLTNLREYQLGTNPNSVDTDGDGMPDGEEVARGRNPRVNEPALMTIINSILLED